MALKYHPDKNQNSPEATAKVRLIGYLAALFFTKLLLSVYL